MIPADKVIEIHRLLIDGFGGSHGIRDLTALESALARPFQTFDKLELYPGLIPKAAALLESFLINHPFVDGNKRTAYVITRILLLSNGCDIMATQNEKYELVINVAAGKYGYDQVLEWLRKQVIEIN